MRLIVEGEQRLRLLAEGIGLDIESTNPNLKFSPLHMLGGSLSTCTFAVLATWAFQLGLEVDDLEIDLSWEYVDNPFRVGKFDLAIRWPSLPAGRQVAALRIAEHCTVEHTLTHPPGIKMRLIE